MPTPTLPSITLARSLPTDAQVLICGVIGADDELTLVGVPAEVEKAYAKKFGPVLDVAKQLGAKSKIGSTTVLPTPSGAKLLLVGLGDGEPSTDEVRRAVASAARAASGLGKEQTVALSLPVDEPEMLTAVAQGALLGAYAFAPITAEPDTTPKIKAFSVLGSKDKEALEAAAIVAEAQCLAREWVNLPANLLYPATFADAAADQARAAKLQVEILDEAALTKQGFGGIMAVGGGSENQPRLVRLSYAPRGAKSHLVLIGKGMTFDSGGLDLKPPASMYTMKCDMGGAAAVLAATKAIAQLGLKVKVTTYAAMAENMPDGAAYRPSDVLTMYGGKTVENANTDAEGRLVMADALARSNEDAGDLVVDVATLTGACMVALGERTFGVMSDSDEVASRLLDAAEAADESAWQLPMPQWLEQSLESKVADLKSSGDRWGGAQFAAAFLRKFVNADTDWGHLDIAGPAFNEGSPRDDVPNGGTGVAVRTLVELARSMAR